MNLQETVSKILGREVSTEEAKDFALNQFGVLTSYLRKPKEYRVYVLDADCSKFTSYDIDNWLSYQEIHGKLTDDAKTFISECERVGNVYTLTGFNNASNLEEINLNNSYIFITNCY